MKTGESNISKERCDYSRGSDGWKEKQKPTGVNFLTGCLAIPVGLIVISILSAIVGNVQDRFDSAVHNAFSKKQLLTVEQEVKFYSESGCPEGCTYQKEGCEIKGNISFDSKEKIYHIPGQKYYDSTKINPDYGERWFCTEAEAKANGWRKSKE